MVTALGNVSYDSSKLSEEEKAIVIAIIFIALNADNQKHVLEINACKIIMATLSVSIIDNVKLKDLTQKTIPDLVALLSPAGKQVALINALRMVIADGHIQEDERHLIQSIASFVPANESNAVKKIALLECGKNFKI